MTHPALPTNAGVLSRYVINRADTPAVSLEALYLRLFPAIDLGDDVPPPPAEPDPALPPPDPAMGPPPLLATTLDQLTDDIWQEQVAAPTMLHWQLHNFRVGDAPEITTNTFSPGWSRIDTPRAEALAAFNLYRKLRSPLSTMQVPVYTPAPPLQVISGKNLPYPRERAQSPHFEYWLNELWGETTDDAVKNLVLRILQGFDNGQPRVRLLPHTDRERQLRDTERHGHNAVPNGRWLDQNEASDAMRLLLRAAVKVMPPVPAVAAKDGDVTRTDLLHLVGPNPDGLAEDLAVAFHGTGRAPADVRAQGTTRTLGIPGRADELESYQHWHPYSPEQRYNNNAYFRCASADNDLNTTVSIGQSPFVSLDFPLIHTLTPDSPAYVAARRRVPDHEYATAGGQRFSARSVREHLVSYCWIYLVLVDDIFDTRSLQGDNPFLSLTTEDVPPGRFVGHGELATRQVPPERHIGAVRYERHHYGPSREDGMSYRMVEVAYVGAFDPPVLGGAQPLCVRFFTDWLRQFPLCGVTRIGDVDQAFRDRCAQTAIDPDYERPPGRYALFPLVYPGIDTHVSNVVDPVTRRQNRAALRDLVDTAYDDIAGRWTATRARIQQAAVAVA